MLLVLLQREKGISFLSARSMGLDGSVFASKLRRLSELAVKIHNVFQLKLINLSRERHTVVCLTSVVHFFDGINYLANSAIGDLFICS